MFSTANDLSKIHALEAIELSRRKKHLQRNRKSAHVHLWRTEGLGFMQLLTSVHCFPFHSVICPSMPHTHLVQQRNKPDLGCTLTVRGTASHSISHGHRPADKRPGLFPLDPVPAEGQEPESPWQWTQLFAPFKEAGAIYRFLSHVGPALVGVILSFAQQEPPHTKSHLAHNRHGDLKNWLLRLLHLSREKSLKGNTAMEEEAQTPHAHAAQDIPHLAHTLPHAFLHHL